MPHWDILHVTNAFSFGGPCHSHKRRHSFARPHRRHNRCLVVPIDFNSFPTKGANFIYYRIKIRVSLTCMTKRLHVIQIQESNEV